MFCRNTLQGLHLAGGDEAVEEHRWHQREQQGDNARQQERDTHILHPRLHQFRLVKQLLQRQHRQQGDGELGDDEYRGHRTELGVHRHIVDEEVRQTHKVLTPREHDTQYGGSQQGPLHGTLHDEQSQDEKRQHEGSHVDGTRRTGLFAPVLANLIVDVDIVAVRMPHGRLVLTQGHRCAALGVGYEQRPRLADTITPLRDIVALQTAAGLVGRVFLDQFTFAAHGLLTVLPCVVKVRQVQADGYQACRDAHPRGLHKVHDLLLTDGLYQPADDQEEDDE